jgi:hypothetical protein
MKTKVSKSLPISEKYSQERINQERALKVMSILKEIAKTGGDIQEYHTPLQICEMMLSKVSLDKAKSILVLYNTELVFALKKSGYLGKITFLTSSLKKVELVQKMNYNVKIEYISKDENPLYHLEMNFPEKFDIVLSNPPYSKKLDIKFISRALELSKGEVVFVSPFTMWTAKDENKYYSSQKQAFLPFLKEITMFNGNGIFGISKFDLICISHFSKDKKEDYFILNDIISGNTNTVKDDSANTISVFGISTEFNLFYEKIRNLKIDFANKKGFVYSTGGNENNRYLRNPNAYFVEFTNVRGHGKLGCEMNEKIHKDDFFTFISSENQVCSGRNPKYNIWFEFETREEAENFLRYIKTDFARMCLALVKRDQNLKLGTLPWIDFTQEWTDKKLYKHFGITKKEQEFIKEIIPPYYD